MEFNARIELSRFDMNWMNPKAIAKEIIEKYKNNIVLKSKPNNVEYSLKLYCSIEDKPENKFREKEGISLDE